MNNGITFTQESDGKYRLNLPDGTIKKGLTLREAADLAEEILDEMRMKENENGNNNSN